ncbi:hypothetical protein XENTR_v10013975 [Xenopus tropicalis]|nr:hypothetical protein XENTR_v10013975 [Xenopus tropicalis]
MQKNLFVIPLAVIGRVRIIMMSGSTCLFTASRSLKGEVSGIPPFTATAAARVRSVKDQFIIVMLIKQPHICRFQATYSISQDKS